MFIQLFNIILPNFFALLHPPYPLFSNILSRHARTQDAVDGLMDPPHFLLPLRVANTVRTVALTVLYMPVLPASTVLGLISAVVSCAPPLFPYIPSHNSSPLLCMPLFASSPSTHSRQLPRQQLPHVLFVRL